MRTCRFYAPTSRLLRRNRILWPNLFLFTHCFCVLVNSPSRIRCTNSFSCSVFITSLKVPTYKTPHLFSSRNNFLSFSSFTKEVHSSMIMAPVSAKNGATNAPVLTPAEKLIALRQLMQEHSIDGYIVYSTDAHDSEYCTAHDERRAFISEFTGSAGVAVITLNEALLWTDGRYFQQAENQLDSTLWTLMKAGLEKTPTISQFIRDSKTVHRLGLDMFTTSIANFQKFEKELKEDVVLVLLEQNLVDKIWGQAQPPIPNNLVFTVPLKYTGVDVSKKLEQIREAFQKNHVKAVLLSALDEIAWTLNLRGSDILYNPVFMAYLLISENTTKLYIDDTRLDGQARQQLQDARVTLRPYAAITNDISELYSIDVENFKIWLDSDINLAIYKSIPDPANNCILEKTPVALKKAVKTPEELQGMREAHIKDGMAECKFFTWLESVKRDKSLFSMTELTLSDKIDGFRAEQDTFVSLSFPSISGIGPNSAIIHYRPEEGSCSQITPSMYLLDSGAQYEEGTTDVTRTTHFGTPSAYEKHCWTCVLKGHIRLAQAVFPSSSKGPQLDVLARLDLWKEGLDYRHGTGHGVGCFLNVHEGPCGITPRLTGPSSTTSLVPGMILSNEPGYYEKEFGIRIENLVVVVDACLPTTFEDTPFYKFETITLIPLDRTLIDFDILTADEVKWINSYHKTVRDTLVPRLEAEETERNIDNSAVIAWIRRETAPL